MAAQFKMVDVPANAVWVDTGLSLTSDQTVSIHASGEVHMYVPEGENLMPWVGPDGGASRVECSFDPDTYKWPLVVNDATGSDHPALLVAAVGDYSERANRFAIGRASQFTGKTGTLYLCVNDYDMDTDPYPDYRFFDDNRGVFHVSILVDPPEECPQTGEGCEANCHEPKSPNPIRLRTADKVLSETDLVLQSPAGTLSFVRIYTQSQQTDSSYQFMGLGWTHNHAIRLELSGSTPERMASVWVAGGGILTLDEDTAGHFVAQAGSTAVMDHDAAAEAYVLMLSDRSQYVFDNTTLRLRERCWPGGEKWTYNHNGSGNLTNVADEYGRELAFTYYSGLTGDDEYKNGQLWRVGDQTATGLEGDTPAGRYVELDYTPEKNDGQRVTGAKPLLASVQAVSESYWSFYNYYGQHEGENNGSLLNFLTRRETSEVDTDGDHIPDAPLVLEELTYSDSSPAQILQRRGYGLLETNFVFQPNGENVTTETVAGKTVTHRFAGGVYVGAENPLGDFPQQAILDDYRAWGKLDANGSPTSLEWSAGGKHLDAVTDALGQETQFTYDEEDRLLTGTDAEGRETAYVYDADLRQPTVIVAGVPVTEVAINGGMEEPDGWSDVGTPQLNVRSSTRVDSGNSSCHVVADAVGEGIQSLTWDLEAGQSYLIRARVYVVKGQVKMQVPGVAAFDAETTQTGVWETVIAKYTPSSADTGQRLQFVAVALDNGECEFYVDTVGITTTGEIDVNGGMEVDTGWSGVGTPTTNEQSTAQVDSGLYSRHVVTDATDEGIQSIPWNLLSGQAYTLRARVYPVGGIGNAMVRMRLVDSSAQEIANTSDTSQVTDAWETLSCLYTPGADVNNVRLQFLADGGTAAFYVDTVSITLADTLPLHGDMEEGNYWPDIPGSEPPTNERSVRVDSGAYFRHVSVDAVNEGIESSAWDLTQDHTYLVMARLYVGKGQVIMQVPGVAAFDAETAQTGVWETLRVIYEHTGSTTSKNLQFVAAVLESGAAEFYVDTVHLLDLGVGSGARKDRLRWQEFAYDTKGRLLAERIVNPEDATLAGETTRSYHAFGPGGGLLYQVIQKDLDGANDKTTTYTYDSAGRVVKTQQLHTFGGCEASYTVYDAAGNVLASICNYDPGTHAAPTTAEEAAALYNDADPDKNQVTAYRYDEMGRRVEVTTNAGADHALTTLTLYDALSRVTRTISGYQQPQGSNPPGDWEWNAQAGQWEDGDQHPISHGTDNTENIITDTTYNQRGQVRLQRDVLGSVTLYGYDDAGRQVKVVRSASIPDYNNDYAGTVPNQADPDLSSYNAASAPARDIVTTAEYDAAGNLIRSIDPMGNATLLIYDALNRLVKTVRSASDPDYDIRHDPTLAKYLFSDAPDLDLIEDTVYETMGRMLYTVDPAGNWTWYAYDALDRQVKVIVNAQGTATDGGVNDPRSDTYTASDDPDQDLISRTHYDGLGRVQWALDPIGRRTWNVYDGLGRPVKTIANCTYDPENPQGVPPEDPGYTGSPDPDKDVISRTIYDADGRVAQAIDGRGNATCYAYDDRGRQTLAVQNFYDDGNIDTNLGQWEWDSTDERWEDGSGVAIPHGGDLDRNLIAWTGYDLAGRVSATRDTAGQETRYEYDALGRRTRTIVNYEDGTYNSNFPDEDLISQTIYNVAGQVTAAVDARGTQTSFEYDAAGRQVVVIQAAGTPLATKTYTCYDKAGRVLRVISNWVEPWGDTPPSPDEREAGNWVFAPDNHGRLNDENLITEYELDRLGRQVGVTDPVGNETITVFNKQGGVEAITDAAEIVTAHRYNRVQQLDAVIQNYHDILLAQIAFVSNRDGNYEIYLMNADGSHPTRLTTQAGRDDLPAWSPDGSQLAFVSDRSGSEEIHLLNVSRGDLVQLTHLGGSIGQIAWSPEGDRIAFDVWIDNHNHVYVMSLRDIVPTRLTPLDTDDYAPVWSPDGKRLMFVSQRDGNDEIYVMYRDGYRPVNLTQHSASDTAPAWSPDGTTILFESNRNGQTYADLYKMAQNGTTVVRLTMDGRSQAATWSPDGEKIAFISNRNGNFDVFVMNADGSSQTQVSTVGNCVRVSWSPDGSQLVFESSQEIYRVNADGTQETRLTNNAVSDMRPVWSPVARVIQPEEWVWNPSSQAWEDGWGHAVDHNAPDNDRNVIATVEYDKAGRRTTLLDPRHNETGYEYDQLNRRTALTDPLSHTWQTEYENLVGGGTRITLTDPASHDTARAFDRLGRLKTIDYLNESPKRTPDVTFTYDLAGNRAAMVEDDGAANVRATGYSYDRARRLTRVDFDTDGDSNTDETVRYEYDAGGLRTRLILPGVGDPSITYAYDAKGRLTGLTDWASHTTTFAFDDANRLANATRANGLRSRYRYDAAGRLRLLRHTEGTRALAHFAYEVDGRGNRTQALEALAPPSGGGMVYAYDNRYITYHGAWTDSAPYKVSSSFSAALSLIFFGYTATLTIGTGPDHGLFDVYVNHSFWQSFDGYTPASGERAIDIPLVSMGPHLLEIRHRHAKNLASSGYKIRFKQLVTPNTAFIRYSYDALSRLQEARYNPASDLDAPDVDLLRRYQYSYDFAGNRTQEIVNDGVAETKADYQYNEANQIWRSRINEGVWNESYAYDNNGNLTSDGVNAYAWDRANRLFSVNNTAYQYGYDGLGSRVSQTVSSIVTQYLLDVQPGLVNMLAQTTGGNTSRFLYGPRVLLAYENSSSDWGEVVRDGLGSVRVEVDDDLVVQAAQHYGPYGVPFGVQGAFGLPFGFTGEPTDANGLVYLRARYYSPTLGVFPSLDLAETLNRYQYVGGNPVSYIDPSGFIGETPYPWDPCRDPDPQENCSCYTGTTYLLPWCQDGIIPECEPQLPPFTPTPPPTNTPRGTPVPPTPPPTNTPRPSPTPDAQTLCDQQLLTVAVANEMAEGGYDIARVIAHIGVNRLRDPQFSSRAPTVKDMIRTNQIGGEQLLSGFENSTCQQIYDFYNNPELYIGSHMPTAQQAVTEAWYRISDPTNTSLWFLVSNRPEVINGAIKINAQAQFDLIRYPTGCGQWWINANSPSTRSVGQLRANILERNGVVLLYSNFMETSLILASLGWPGCGTYCTDPTDPRTCNS